MLEIKMEDLVGIEGISPLTQRDEKLFRTQVKSKRPSDNCDFKDSWAYILQSTRKFPMKVQIGDNLFLIGVKDDEADPAIVIPNYFSDIENLQDVSLQLRRAFNLPVILKNVDVSDAESILGEGRFRKYQFWEVWTVESPYDDQTYPQRVVGLQSLISAKGKNYANFRNGLNQTSSLPLQIRCYSKSDDSKELEKLLREQNTRLDEQAYKANRIFLDLKHSDRITLLTFLTEGRIIGFTAMDEISKECIAWNSIIYSTDVPHLSRRMLYETARVALSKGYNYLNFQGSETKSLDDWKQRFKPEKSIEKIHLIYK